MFVTVEHEKFKATFTFVYHAHFRPIVIPVQARGREAQSEILDAQSVSSGVFTLLQGKKLNGRCGYA